MLGDAKRAHPPTRTKTFKIKSAQKKNSDFILKPDTWCVCNAVVEEDSWIESVEFVEL